MKTILRIMIILAAASVVAGIFFLALNNGANTAIPNEGGQLPALTSNGQFTDEPMDHPEMGDHDDLFDVRGLGEILGTLAKLTFTILAVLLIQKAVSARGKQKLISL